MHNDLLIIGAGPGGYETAVYAAGKGLQVTIIEGGRLGGTCLNCGCIPTKSLVHDAEKAAFAADKAAAFTAAIARKNEVISGLREGVSSLMHAPGITLVEGMANFKDSHTVVANGEEYTADNIIIATGSTAKIPPIPGISLADGTRNPRVVSAEQLLDLETLPQRLCIVGAGVIGMEMASVFRSFGTEVTVVEFLKECLPSVDSEIAKRLRKVLEKSSIRFELNSGVQRIEDNKVVFANNKTGKECAVEADVILVATGRQARVDGLNVDAAGIETGRTGIVVDDDFLTNVPNIYAIGDVNGRQMLAHAATFQGYHAVNHILGKDANIRFDIMPSAVFTHPEAASVGLTEDACKAQGIACTAQKAMYRANGRARAMEETEGLVKIIYAGDGKIMGCHAFGADCSSMIQEISALMNLGITKERLADIIHIHPTLSEIVLMAAK